MKKILIEIFIGVVFVATVSAQEKPEIYIQMGHNSRIGSICFSPDSRFIASASDDSKVKLWNIMSKKVIRTFIGHKLPVYYVSFAPDGKSVATASADKSLKIWDVASGKELRTFLGHTGRINYVIFSPDGWNIVSASSDKTMKLWDVRTGNEVRRFIGHKESVDSVSFSPDGSYIVSGSRDKTIKLWEVSTGKVLKTILIDKEILVSVIFSPDGRYIAYSAGNSIVIWDIKIDKELCSLVGHTKSVASLCFSPDGHKMASCSWDDTVRVWDIATASEQNFLLWKSGEGISCIRFSPDGRYIAAGSGNKVKLWDALNVSELFILTGPTNPVMHVKCSPDGRYVASETGAINIKIWDMGSGRELVTFAGQMFNSNLSFSPDGRRLAAGSVGNTVSLWDMGSGKKCQSLTGHTDVINSVSFSPDGRNIVSASSDKTIKLWDVQTGIELKNFTGHKASVNSVSYSSDGRYIVSGSMDKTVRLWEVSTGNELRTIARDEITVTSVIFSPCDRYIAFGSGRTIKIINLESGRTAQILSGHSEIVWSIAFSPDGKYIASGSWDKTVRLWEVASGREILQFKGHSESVWSVTFSPDGKYLITGSWDGTTRIWNIKTAGWVAFTSLPFGTQWLIFTHDGYWDGTPNCGELVAMVRGNECWNIDQFAVKNNRPDIILQRLGSENKELIAHYYGQYLKRLRKIGLTEDKLAADYIVPEARILEAKHDGKFISLKFALSDKKYQLKSYNVYVNDVPLFGSYGKEIAGNSLTITERVELTYGENKIEIGAMNEKGAESFRALAYAKYDTPLKGDLYFIGFGVSEYKDKELNLSYAHKDVLDLAAVFSGMKGRFGDIYIHTFVNGQVTVENIKEAKDLLAHAKVNDTFVLFISGHGVHDTDKEATYYYITHETDVNNLEKTAANFEIIEELLQGIAPRNKLFLIDTCEAGEAEESVQNQYLAMAERKGIKPRVIKYERGLKLEARHPARTYLAEKDRYIYNDLSRRSGAIVFSSCRGGEFSYEDDVVQNGFFTAKIIEALKSNAADKNKDGVVSIDELRDYVSREVPKMTADETSPEGLQHPTVDRDNIYIKFGF